MVIIKGVKPFRDLAELIKEKEEYFFGIQLKFPKTKGELAKTNFQTYCCRRTCVTCNMQFKTRFNDFVRAY